MSELLSQEEIDRQLGATDSQIKKVDNNWKNEPHCRENHSTDDLEVILWVIGEFGSRLNALRRPDGTFPAPKFKGLRGISEEIPRYFLEGMAIIQARELDNWYRCQETCQWKQGKTPTATRTVVLKQGLVFSSSFRKRLSEGENTIWAQNLSYSEFEHLMDFYKGYSERTFYTVPPTYLHSDGCDPQISSGMRAALRMITKIYESGPGYSLAEAIDWIKKQQV